ncbi:sodium channel protein Nach-like isoform X2 [Prorops nasuta]|uniref:sodium channel protein Nach-like isoform X2 n=1 Tax=Prorops nasuta TaxID=863751 RepID=UPI0034CE8061
MMMHVWRNFDQNPTVTTIDAAHPIRNLPFPGVTICNNNKVYKPRTREFRKIMQSNGLNSSEMDQYFLLLSKLVRPERIEANNSMLTGVLGFLNVSVEGLMYQLRQPCSSMLISCSWLGYRYDCSKIFKTVKSNQGFCCAFNYHFWMPQTFDYGFDETLDDERSGTKNWPNDTEEHLPGVDKVQMSAGAGRDKGLSVLLDVEAESYESSVSPYAGLLILIHDPHDFPDIDVQSATLLPGQRLAVSLDGTGIESEQNLREMEPRKRKCWFDDEAEKKYKSYYSYQSCVSNCLYKQMNGTCGCLPFFYPGIGKQRIVARLAHTSQFCLPPLTHHTFSSFHVHICTAEGESTCYLSDIHCLLSVAVRARITCIFSIIPEQLSGATQDSLDQCYCLPQCSDISYDIATENIDMKDVPHDIEILRGYDIRNVSLMYVYFSDTTYLMYRRHSISSWYDLLASFGGIFGLCLGGSVISVVELFYLFVMEFLGLRRRLRRRSIPLATELFRPAANLGKSRGATADHPPPLDKERIFSIGAINKTVNGHSTCSIARS